MESDESQQIVDEQQEVVLPQLPNEVILKIVKYLDTNSLLIFREMNSGWKTHASRILRQQNLPKIVLSTLDSPSSPPHFVNVNGFPQKNLILDSLVGTLQSTQIIFKLDEFPCTHVQFQGVDLYERNVLTLFKLYGHHLRRLDLTKKCADREDPYGSMKTLCQILAQCPNLEHLVIDKYGKYNYYLKDSLKLTSPLTKLKKLECKSQRIVNGILDSAPNLESFTGLRCRGFDSYLQDEESYDHDVDIFNLDKFISSNKIHIIHDLHVNFTNRNAHLYEGFAEHQLQLKTLTFESRRVEPYLGSRLSSLLNKLLESSNETLEVIDNLDVNIPRSVQIPRLTQLNRLGLKFDGYHGMGTRWALDNNLANPLDRFPNLTEVVIDIREEDVYNALPEFTTVTKLTLHCIVYTIPGQDLRGVFPNVVHLTVKDIHSKDLRTLCRGIWEHLKNLESLELTDILLDGSVNAEPSLDEALTGFEKETCETLACHLKGGNEGPHDLWEGRTVDQMRKYASVLEMKRLKRFKIHMYNERDGLMGQPLTPVSIVYAVKQMPQLQLSMVVEIKNANNHKEWFGYCLNFLVVKDQLARLVPLVASLKIALKGHA